MHWNAAKVIRKIGTAILQAASESSQNQTAETFRSYKGRAMQICMVAVTAQGDALSCTKVMMLVGP